MTLLLIGIGFQVVLATTPLVSGSLGDGGGVCGAAVYCADCITTSGCGFCYADAVNASFYNGSCLPFAAANPGVSLNGSCSANVSGLAPTWANNYCPSPYSSLVLAGLIVFIFVYAPGMGAMPWTVNTEIYPQWMRSVGNAASIAVNWGTNLLTTFTFLSLTQALSTPGAYYLYTAITFLGTAILFLIQPETRGKSLEEVLLLLVAFS